MLSLPSFVANPPRGTKLLLQCSPCSYFLATHAWSLKFAQFFRQSTIFISALTVSVAFVNIRLTSSTRVSLNVRLKWRVSGVGKAVFAELRKACEQIVSFLSRRNCCENFAALMKCDCNGSLTNRTGPTVDQHRFTFSQICSQFQCVIGCYVGNRNCGGIA